MVSDSTQKGERAVALLTSVLIITMQVYMITIWTQSRVNFKALSISENCDMFGMMVTVPVSYV